MGNSRSKTIQTPNQHIKLISHSQTIRQSYNVPTTTPTQRKTHAKQVNIEFINNEIEQRTKSLSEQLKLDPTVCLLLLRKYRWNTDTITEAINMWSNQNLDQILTGAGVYVHINSKNAINKHQNGDTIECQMCLNPTKQNDLYGMECGHNEICKSCWIHYLQHFAKTKACVFTKCPQFACNVIVNESVFKLFLHNKYETEFEYQRYLRFCRAHFIENNPHLCSCPWEECTMVYRRDNIQIQQKGFIECCGCSHTFCITCGESPHKHTPCADSWLESTANLLWILSNTKSCPRCKRRIQRRAGSIHMTCRRHAGGCGHDFCWHCLGAWSRHGAVTGGYYECNIYQRNNKQFVLIDEALIMYYNRYNNDNNDDMTHIDMVKCEMGTKYEAQFLWYQLARIWVKRLNDNNDDDDGNEWMKYCVNFNCCTQNILFLCSGYIRMKCAAYVPTELIQCVVSFYVDIDDIKRSNDLKDEWDLSSVVQHTKNKDRLSDILFENNDYTMVQIRKHDFVTLVTIQSELQLVANAVVRHIWNIKLSFLSEDHECTEYFEIGIHSEPSYFGIKACDLGSLKSGYIVSILIINFEESGLIKFAINGKTLQNKTTIFNTKHSTDDIYRLQLTLPENMKANIL